MSNDYSQDEAFAIMEAWKPVLEELHKLYAQIMSGSMSGIVLIIATIGFNFDNITKLHSAQKWLLIISLFSLIIALGNSLNSLRLIDFIQGFFGGRKSKIILDKMTLVPHQEVVDIQNMVLEKITYSAMYYKYAYWCFLIAVALGILGFISILLQF